MKLGPTAHFWPNAKKICLICGSNPAKLLQRISTLKLSGRYEVTACISSLEFSAQYTEVDGLKVEFKHNDFWYWINFNESLSLADAFGSKFEQSEHEAASWLILKNNSISILNNPTQTAIDSSEVCVSKDAVGTDHCALPLLNGVALSDYNTLVDLNCYPSLAGIILAGKIQTATSEWLNDPGSDNLDLALLGWARIAELTEYVSQS
jgi:hypothetical protein